MTASFNRQGEIVLCADDEDKLKIKSGDLFVVSREKSGRVVLKRAIQSPVGTKVNANYLTPPPLPRSVLNRIYTKADPDWDTIEEKAVAEGRRALTGMRLQDL